MSKLPGTLKPRPTKKQAKRSPKRRLPKTKVNRTSLLRGKFAAYEASPTYSRDCPLSRRSKYNAESEYLKHLAARIEASRSVTV